VARFFLNRLGLEFWSRMSHANQSALGLFALLGERRLLNLLRKVPVKVLMRLMETSKALYCACNYSKIWKRICIKRWEGAFD
jgi:hypothetical protein